MSYCVVVGGVEIALHLHLDAAQISSVRRKKVIVAYFSVSCAHWAEVTGDQAATSLYIAVQLEVIGDQAAASLYIAVQLRIL